MAMAASTTRVLFLAALLAPAVLAANYTGAMMGTSDRGAQAAKSDAQGAKEIPVKVLFVRQGYQCKEATEAHATGLKSSAAAKFMADPGLTECGRVQATKAGEALKQQGVQPDLVLTSSLMSAIETASDMFPGTAVMPVPFLAGGTSARELAKQEEVLASDAGKKVKVSIDKSWTDVPGFGPVRNVNDPNGFVDFMANNFMPSISAELKKKESLTIVVVAHWESISKLVKKSCNDKAGMQYAEVVEIPFAFKTYATVGVGKRAPVKSEEMPDPYVTDAAKAWETMQKVAEDKQLQESLLPLIGKPNLNVPFHDRSATMAFYVGVQRAFEQGKECKVVHEGAEAPGQLCAKDFGKVCSAELDGFHSALRPDVKFSDGGACCVGS